MIITLYGIIEYKGKYYCLEKNTGLFYAVDENNKKIECLGYVNKDSNEIYIASVLYDNKIYFAPYRGDSIVSFDVEKKTFSRNEKLFCINNRRIYGCNYGVLRDNTIYWLCDNEIPLVSMNMETGILSDCIRKSGVNIHDDIRINFSGWSECCLLDSHLILPLQEKNSLLIFNMDDHTWVKKKIGNTEMMFDTIVYDGESIWLTGNEICLVKWNWKTDDYIELRDFPLGFKQNNYASRQGLFVGGMLLGERILFAPLAANMFITIDKNNNTIENYTFMQRDKWCTTFKKINPIKAYLEMNALNEIGGRSRSYFIKCIDNMIEKSEIILETSNYNVNIFEEFKSKNNRSNSIMNDDLNILINILTSENSNKIRNE